jgi:hypothetical protein
VPESVTARVEWLKSLRSIAIDAIERTEAGLHYVGSVGDEHMRDAAEAWLEHHRAFVAKIERRIRLESGGGA